MGLTGMFLVHGNKGKKRCSRERKVKNKKIEKIIKLSVWKQKSHAPKFMYILGHTDPTFNPKDTRLRHYTGYFC